jgi:hypothetical protein
VNPTQDQYNALMKIRSIVFNMAQEGRITNAELEDYNQAAANAFEALEDFRFLLRKNAEEKKVAYQARDKALSNQKKLQVIIEMLGLTREGVKQMINFPLRFLNSVNKALINYNSTLETEEDFRCIEQAWHWLRRNINTDKRNISTIKLQKKLYESEHEEVKELAREIMQQVGAQSGHIVDGLRQGKEFEELKPAIEKHWYGELSTHNITGRKTR